MNPDLLEIWQATLDEIEKEASKPSFETWFKTTKPVSLHDDTLVVSVPNDFTKDWLQGHYFDLINAELQSVLNNDAVHVHL